jgi:hypothetical protein
MACPGTSFESCRTSRSLFGENLRRPDDLASKLTPFRKMRRFKIMIVGDMEWVSFNHEAKLPLGASPEQIEQVKAEALEAIKKKFEQESGLSFEKYGRFAFSSTMGVFHYAVTQTGAPPQWRRP